MPKKSAKGARRNQNNNVIAQNNNSPTEPGQMVASKLAETENSKSGIPAADSNLKTQQTNSSLLTNGVSKTGDELFSRAAKSSCCCSAAKSVCAKSQPKNNTGDISESSANQMAEKAKKHDEKGAADLERVTDYFEEKELISGSNSGSMPAGGSGILSGGIEEAMKALSEKTAREREEKLAYERELRKVPINKEHVELIVQEMEISRMEAERCLRKHGGDPVKTLITLTT